MATVNLCLGKKFEDTKRVIINCKLKGR